MLSDTEIRALFAQPRTIAVVGLSEKPARASHGVASMLQQRGHRIIPVNPRLYRPVLHEQPYARLRDILVPIDIVDIFRRSECVSEIVDDAIAIGARVIWMQLGVIDQDAADRAIAAGLGVVMDRCPKIEYYRLGL